jgi:hypothetical protein
MNLFRSEEHARRWAQWNPETAAMLQPLAFWADLFAAEMFRARARNDYVSWLRSAAGRDAAQAFRARLPAADA